MASHGQFCSVARAQEALGGRWTLLIVRELLCGSRRFNDIRRGIPRISRTVLSERLRALAHLGVIVRTEGAQGPEYEPTAAGRELMALIQALGVWGQRWLPRQADEEDLDLQPVLIDMARRVRAETLPAEPLVVSFVIAGRRPRFLLLRRADSAACDHNPGFPEPLSVHGPLAPLASWWRGDASFPEAQRRGLVLRGPRTLVRAFPDWFDRYLFAGVAPAIVRESAA